MAMGSPSRRHGRRRTPMAEINVTPLVDVMLVLLIIFMVTAPMLTQGVKIELPKVAAEALATDTRQQILTLSVKADGGYYWNAGMFVLRASAWMAALERFRPDIASACRAAWAARSTDAVFVRPGKVEFEAVPS